MVLCINIREGDLGINHTGDQIAYLKISFFKAVFKSATLVALVNRCNPTEVQVQFNRKANII